MIIAPVSGSKKTNKDGIKVINKAFRRTLNSSRIFLDFIFASILLKYKARLNFISSLGWKEKKGSLNHALEPLIVVPKNNTNIRRSTLIQYKYAEYRKKILGFKI